VPVVRWDGRNLRGKKVVRVKKKKGLGVFDGFFCDIGVNRRGGDHHNTRQQQEQQLLLLLLSMEHCSMHGRSP
jgi:hypothetical protein